MKKVNIRMGRVLIILSVLLFLTACQVVRRPAAEVSQGRPSQTPSQEVSEAASEGQSSQEASQPAEEVPAEANSEAVESVAEEPAEASSEPVAESSAEASSESSEASETSEKPEASEAFDSSEISESPEASESFGLSPEAREAYLRALYPEAAAKLDEIGWDLRTAYDWVAAFRYVEEAPIDWELGTKWYAQLGFETGEGHCYTFAAMMTEFARLLGYEARQVAGNLIGNNPFHHSWVEIDIDGTTYVLDPEVQQEWDQDCYLVIYGTDEAIPYDTDALTYMPDNPTPQSLERLELSSWNPGETEEEYDPNTGCFN